MGILSAILSPITAITTAVGNYFDGKNKIKRAAIDAEVKIAGARTTAIVDAYKAGIMADSKVQMMTLSNLGNTNKLAERIANLISIPMIAAFIPYAPLQSILYTSMDLIGQMPDLYVQAWLAMVSTVFGVRIYKDVQKSGNEQSSQRLRELAQLHQTINASSQVMAVAK